LLIQRDTRWVVFDLDSDLSFPCDFGEYIDICIRPEMPILSSYRRFFKVLPVGEFLASFSSDRSHMKDSGGITDILIVIIKDGNWLAPPPSWDCILHNSVQTNLFDDYVNMHNNIGEVLDETNFISKFSAIK
jgi:hypothetical protein